MALTQPSKGTGVRKRNRCWNRFGTAAAWRPRLQSVPQGIRLRTSLPTAAGQATDGRWLTGTATCTGTSGERWQLDCGPWTDASVCLADDPCLLYTSDAADDLLC